MCLAVVGKVLKLEKDSAVVDIEGNQVNISTVLVPKVKVNECVLMHTGFAISIISEADYEEHRRLFREIEEYATKILDTE